jgi:hypothetical protein
MGKGTDRRGLGYSQYCSDEFKVIALAPLTPQFWGEMTKDFGFLPPELGGWGGQCKVYGLSEQYWVYSYML